MAVRSQASGIWLIYDMKYYAVTSDAECFGILVYGGSLKPGKFACSLAWEIRRLVDWLPSNALLALAFCAHGGWPSGHNDFRIPLI